MQSNVILDNLNNQQKQGVTTTRGPLLILSGAGSGKTRVLTRRVAYLIRHDHVSPWNILALTFTNKAAQEMKARISKLLNTEKTHVWASTFHSLGVAILRRYGYVIGRSSDFTILDPSVQKKTMKKIITQRMNLDPHKYHPASFLHKISMAKSELMTPASYYHYMKEDHRSYDFEWKKYCQAYQIYQKVLKINQDYDFDDLIMLPVLIFRKAPQVLKKYQKRFKFILVDEYQDTNHAQYEMTNLIAERYQNLCVVGDVDQSIYGWRGADIRNILDFKQDYPKAHVIKMEENYRSTKNILRAANSIIQNNPNSRRKHLWTQKPDGDKLRYHRNKDSTAEANFVARTIRNLVKNHKAHYQDFAILYRVNAQSRAFEDAIVGLNIPYQMVGSYRYYDRSEVKDVLAFLSIINNPQDSLNFLRIINKPKRGIGSKSIDKLRDFADKKHLELLDATQHLRGSHIQTQNRIAKLGKILLTVRRQVDKLSITDLTKLVLKRTDYLPYLKEHAKKSNSVKERLRNVLEMFTVTEDFDKHHSISQSNRLSLFLSHITLIAGQDTDNQKDSVSLMTVNAAKGLEFPIVFMVGMEDGVFLSSLLIMIQPKWKKNAV